MKAVVVLIGVLCLTSCSGMQIERVVEGSCEDGLRFYRPEPYLLVTATEKDLNTTVVWLPNYAEEYVLREKGWFGSTEIEATLTDGWNLTKIGSKPESQVPETMTSLGGVIGAVATMIEKSKTAAIEMEPELRVLEPGLYKVVYEKGQVVGLRRVDLLEHPSH